MLEQLHEVSSSECDQHIPHSQTHKLYTCKHLSGHTCQATPVRPHLSGRTCQATPVRPHLSGHTCQATPTHAVRKRGMMWIRISSIRVTSGTSVHFHVYHTTYTVAWCGLADLSLSLSVSLSLPLFRCDQYIELKVISSITLTTVFLATVLLARSVSEIGK